MARKAATATIPGTNVPMGAPAPKEAPKAPRAPRMRVVEGGAAIDPNARNAKELLAARFPKVLHVGTVEAPIGSERFAVEYLELNAQIKKIDDRKEVCANHLKAAIGAQEGIESDAFKALWGERDGTIDWKALCEKKGITEREIETFRKAGGRTLTVSGKD